MNIRSFAAAAVIAAATGAACLANAEAASAQDASTQAAKGQSAPSAVTSELELLKAQLTMLQERLAQLEAAQKSQAEKTESVVADQAVVNTDLQDSIDRTSDNLARTVGEGASSGWLGRWVWKGDLRLRNETIDQEATAAERNRNRFRLRVGATARVNDTTRVEVQFASTEGGDARSSNQSFTDANSRKALDLDTAFVEWSPNDNGRYSAARCVTRGCVRRAFSLITTSIPKASACSGSRQRTGFSAALS